MERTGSSAALSDRTRLYDLLGVNRDATRKEIQKGYRRKAMHAHPDKGGSKEEFQKIQYAHEVLTDPEKRKIYDKFGEYGLQMRNGAGVFIPKEMVETSRLMCVCCLLTLLFAIFFLFIALRFQQSITWNWSTIWVPMWIFNTIICLSLMSKTCTKVDPEQPTLPCSFLMGFALFLSFQIMFIMKADGSFEASWWYVFIPVIPLELMVFQRIVAMLFDPIARLSGEWFRQFRTFVAQVTFIIFFICRMEGIVTWDWSIVFLPIYGGKILFLMLDCCVVYVQRKVMDEETQRNHCAMLQISMCCVCYISLFFGLLIGWLDKGTVPAVVVFLPLIIPLFCLCCLCCCGCFQALCYAATPDLYDEDAGFKEYSEGNGAKNRSEKEKEPMKVNIPTTENKAKEEHIIPITDDADEMD